MIGALYEIVLDGICPNGYSPLSNEIECKALTGQTISNLGPIPLIFTQTGCAESWTPALTCFAYGYSGLWFIYFVDKDCGQNPDYSTNQLICKKNGNNFLTFQ